MTPAFRNSLMAVFWTEAIHALIADGKGDTKQAELARDMGADAFNRASPRTQELLNELSAELNRLREARE